MSSWKFLGTYTIETRKNDRNYINNENAIDLLNKINILHIVISRTGTITEWLDEAYNIPLSLQADLILLFTYVANG